MRRPIPVPVKGFSGVAAMSSERRRKTSPDLAGAPVDPAVVGLVDLAGAAVEASAGAVAPVAQVVAATALREAGSSATAGKPTAFTA